MALREYNINPGQDKIAVTKNATATAVTGGATTLGGTIEIRLLIDDTVAPSKLEVLRAIEVLTYRVTEDTWPQS